MEKQDFKKDITNQVIKLMEKNGSNWIKGWAGDTALQMPVNPTTKNMYKGINMVRLWLAEKGTHEWATYKQWQEAGKQVKKGSKATKVIRYVQIKDKDENGQDKEPEMIIPIMKTFSVFNADQLEGYVSTGSNGKGEEFNNQSADDFIAQTEAVIKNEGASAFYSSQEDYINMPTMQSFIDTDDASAEQSYYGTLLHELTHWTGAANRLNRDQSMNEKKICI